MSADWESYRVVTPSGQVRGLVYRLGGERLLMKRRIDTYATADSTYDSIKELERVLKKKRWALKKVSWFS